MADPPEDEPDLTVPDGRDPPVRPSTGPTGDDPERQPTPPESPMVPDLRRPPPSPRKALPALVIPIIAMIVMTNLGNAFAPTLLADGGNPALLLLLNSQNRYLALATNSLDPLPYFGIGMFRLLLPDPFFYLLGFWYGETVIRWIEEKSQTYGLAIRQMEKLFDKASWVVVTIFPNNYVCLLAGTAGMSPIVFAVLDVIGTAGRLVLFRLFGQAFQDQLQSILDFITTYRWPLTALSFGLVALTLLRDWRGGKGQIEGILDLEEEIETDFGSDP